MKIMNEKNLEICFLNKDSECITRDIGFPEDGC